MCLLKAKEFKIKKKIILNFSQNLIQDEITVTEIRQNTVSPIIIKLSTFIRLK